MNNQIEEITVWKTTDGIQYFEKEQALSHQSDLNIKQVIKEILEESDNIHLDLRARQEVANALVKQKDRIIATFINNR